MDVGGTRLPPIAKAHSHKAQDPYLTDSSRLPAAHPVPRVDVCAIGEEIDGTDIEFDDRDLVDDRICAGVSSGVNERPGWAVAV